GGRRGKLRDPRAERREWHRPDQRSDARAERGGDRQRPDETEQLGVANMDERHVAERQKQQQPRQGQRGAGRKAERDYPQEPNLQRLKLLEIRALPLAERGLQRRHTDQQERLEKA